MFTHDFYYIVPDDYKVDKFKTIPLKIRVEARKYSGEDEPEIVWVNKSEIADKLAFPRDCEREIRHSVRDEFYKQEQAIEAMDGSGIDKLAMVYAAIILALVLLIILKN